MMRIHVLRCGSTVVDEALPVGKRSRNPLAYTGLFRTAKHKISVPVTSYLIEHPRGLLLVDTGWDIKIRTDARGYEGFANYFASPGTLPEGEAVTEHLARLGYTPSDIDLCFLTHMDIDHAGGLQLVKDARRIQTSRKEWDAAQGSHPRYRKALWEGLNVEPVELEHTGLGPVGESLDVFGDGSVQLVALPGHSAGMTGLLLQDGEKFVIITGDGAYCHASWEKELLPGITYNRALAARTVHWLHEMSLKPGCVELLATHDPEIEPHIIEL